MVEAFIISWFQFWFKVDCYAILLFVSGWLIFNTIKLLAIAVPALIDFIGCSYEKAVNLIADQLRKMIRRLRHP